MSFSKLTLVSFLVQAAFFNIVGTNKTLYSATVLLEKQQEETLQGGDFFSNKKSNLCGDKFRSSKRILSSDDNGGKQSITKIEGHDDFVTLHMEFQSDPHQIVSLPDDGVMTFEYEEEL